MRTAHYQRSEILSFYDLNENEQDTQLENQPYSGYAMGDSYVRYKDDVLSIGNFSRTDRGLWHGVFLQTFFSAYFIRFNRSNDEALIAYRYI